MSEQSAPGLSVAMSGGGHRASLFTLGALLYLVDSGRNREVSSIASVSGGSLTNGVVAQATVPFPDMEREDFLEATGPLIKRCAYRGTVVLAPEVAVWALALLGAIGALVLVCVGGAPGWLPDTLGRWRQPASVVALILVISGLVACRTRLADLVFRRQLFRRNSKTTTLGDIQAPEERGGKVTHVFCASELQSSLHTYFSGRFVYNQRFGVATAAASDGLARLPLSTVVQASACFPPAFPPRRLKASRLGLPLYADKKLWLTDGGVYDNMGEQFAVGFYQRTQTVDGPAEVFGTRPTRLLVVNSSYDGPWQSVGLLMRIPVLGELPIFGQIVKLMHRVGTTNRRSRLIDEFDLCRSGGYTPRVQQLIGPPGTLVHIGTPADWPLHKPTGQRSRRRIAVETALAASPTVRDGWSSESFTLARDLGTGLAKVGEKKAMALIWQGYVQCMVNMSIYADDEATGQLETARTGSNQFPILTQGEVQGLVRGSRSRRPLRG